MNLLKALSHGAVGSQETLEAKASLDRVANRTIVMASSALRMITSAGDYSGFLSGDGSRSQRRGAAKAATRLTGGSLTSAACQRHRPHLELSDSKATTPYLRDSSLLQQISSLPPSQVWPTIRGYDPRQRGPERKRVSMEHHHLKTNRDPSARVGWLSLGHLRPLRCRAWRIPHTCLTGSRPADAGLDFRFFQLFWPQLRNSFLCRRNISV